MFEVKRGLVRDVKIDCVVCRCVLSNAVLYTVRLLQAKPYMPIAIVKASDLIRLLYYYYKKEYISPPHRVVKPGKS